MQKNTVCEEVDLSDNYTSCDGAVALARMLTENLFVSNMVGLDQLRVVLMIRF